MPEESAKQMSGIASALVYLFLGSPLKLWASVGHWAIWHFDINKYTEKQRPRVRYPHLTLMAATMQPAEPASGSLVAKQGASHALDTCLIHIMSEKCSSAGLAY